MSMNMNAYFSLNCVCLLFSSVFLSPPLLPHSLAWRVVISQRRCWRWRLPAGLRVWYQPTRWLRLTSPTTRWNSGSSATPHPEPVRPEFWAERVSGKPHQIIETVVKFSMLTTTTCLLSWNPERVCLHEHVSTRTNVTIYLNDGTTGWL